MPATTLTSCWFSNPHCFGWFSVLVRVVLAPRRVELTIRGGQGHHDGPQLRFRGLVEYIAKSVSCAHLFGSMHKNIVS